MIRYFQKIENFDFDYLCFKIYSKNDQFSLEKWSKIFQKKIFGVPHGWQGLTVVSWAKLLATEEAPTEHRLLDIFKSLFDPFLTLSRLFLLDNASEKHINSNIVPLAFSFLCVGHSLRSVPPHSALEQLSSRSAMLVAILLVKGMVVTRSTNASIVYAHNSFNDPIIFECIQCIPIFQWRCLGTIVNIKIFHCIHGGRGYDGDGLTRYIDCLRGLRDRLPMPSGLHSEDKMDWPSSWIQTWLGNGRQVSPPKFSNTLTIAILTARWYVKNEFKNIRCTFLEYLRVPKCRSVLGTYFKTYLTFNHVQYF